jgi:hypothetical protein
MGQPGLFSRSQSATMRDRTKLRNYSPEADKFRRDHKRHRDWGLTQRHARRLRQIRDRSDCSRTPSTAGNPRPSTAGNPRPSTAGNPRPSTAGDPRPDQARHPSGPLGDGPLQPEQIDLTAPTPRPSRREQPTNTGPTRREQPTNTGPDQTGASSPSPARVHGTPVQATGPGHPDPAGQYQPDPRSKRTAPARRAAPPPNCRDTPPPACRPTTRRAVRHGSARADEKRCSRPTEKESPLPGHCQRIPAGVSSRHHFTSNGHPSSTPGTI